MSRTAYRRPDKVLVYLYRRLSSEGAANEIEYLLLQRYAETTNAGAIWQTVVGTVKWGEERVEAARREVFEETGLTQLRGITAIGFAFSFPIRLRKDQQSWYAPDVTVINNTVYASGVVTARPIALCPEHVDFGWFPFAEAMARLHWPEEKEALARLHPMIAAQVQQKLYPKSSPQLSGFDIAGTVFSAEVMCGDYYDFIEMPDGLLAIAIGDVSGHGFGQALIGVQILPFIGRMSRQGFLGPIRQP